MSCIVVEETVMNIDFVTTQRKYNRPCGRGPLIPLGIFAHVCQLAKFTNSTRRLLLLYLIHVR